MKKIAALVKTPRDRAATVKSGSTVFIVSHSSREPSAQLKSSASNARNKITMNVSGGEIVRRYLNYLLIN